MIIAWKKISRGTVFVLALMAASEAYSEDAGSQAVLDLAGEYLSCFELLGVENNAARLACYDGLSDFVREAVDRVAVGVMDCSVREFNFTRETRRYVRFAGTMSCPRGTLAYQIHSANGDFLGAGTAPFDGYVFSFHYEISGTHETLKLTATSLARP